MVKSQLIDLNPLGSAWGIFYFKNILFFFAFSISLSSQAQARLKITNPKHNFGYVKRGELIKSEFEISNTGNEPLIIKDVEISCSCTSVEYTKQPLLPNQKTIITVSFDTKTVYGRQDRVVLLHSNASNSPAKLRYKGVVSNK